VRRGLLVAGILAIALLVFLLWVGVISFGQIQDSLLRQARDLQSRVESVGDWEVGDARETPDGQGECSGIC
jgi:hypothetical protein